MVVMNFRWSRIWERGNFEFPAVMKIPTIWEISMTITCPITIQHFYDLRLPIIWLDKYIIIQKMSNMKGLYQVPLYYFLCTTDRVKYTHFVIQFWNIGSVDMEGEDDWFWSKVVCKLESNTKKNWTHVFKFHYADYFW